MPGQTEPQQASDQSQESEPLSEGSLFGGGGVNHQIHGHAPTSLSDSNSAQQGATAVPNINQASSGSRGSSRDEPDCLLDVILDTVAPQTDSASAYVRHDDSNNTLSSLKNDNPPSYSDLNSVHLPVDKSKPPRYKVVVPSNPNDMIEDPGTPSSDEGSVTTSNSNGNLSYGDKPSLRIGINLLRASKRLLDFLSVVNKEPRLYAGEVVRSAIFRYEHLWLPLLSDYIIQTNGKGIMIAPSLDIHWVWLVHMLAPQHYIKDCKAVVGQMLPHRLLTHRALSIARERGKELWMKTYPNEPWEIDYDNVCEPPDDLPSKISYNILKAVGRQSAFYYQVSLNHYRKGPFLRSGIRRYRQFLHLKMQEPNAFLVPCYDTDLIWHSHQVHPSIYFNDTHAFLGRLLPHDDSVNDRNAGSKLVVSDGNTRKLWKETWGEDFRKDGGMYRGDPPNTYLSPVPEDLYHHARLPSYNVQILGITFKGKLPEGELKVKFRQQAMVIGDVTLTNDGKGEEHNIESANLKFSLHEHNLQQWFVVKVAPSKKLGRLLSMLGDKKFWCMTNLIELFNCSNGQVFSKTLSDANFKVIVKFKADIVPTQYYVKMDTLTGRFITVNVPIIKLTAQTGMVVCQNHNRHPSISSNPSTPPLTPAEVDAASIQNILYTGSLGRGMKASDLKDSPKLLRKAVDFKPSAPPQIEDINTGKLETFEVQMATHRIVNSQHPSHPQLLQVEVSHSKQLMFSGIHVYSAYETLCRSDDASAPATVKPAGQKTLVALAHTLDPNTLPSPKMLKMTGTDWKKEATAMCDWDASERAMIIKGKGGIDWAIVIGCWTGFRKGVPGRMSYRGVPGSSGELSVRVHCPVNSAPKHYKLPYSKKQYHIPLGSSFLDLGDGSLQVASGEPDFVENITLSLAVSVLHVLCQPFPDSEAPFDSVDGGVMPPITTNLPNRIPVEKLAFLGAVGLSCALAPTNRMRRLASIRDSSRRSYSITCDYPLVPMLIAANQYGGTVSGGDDDGGVGACGACGGCGGCGGGVEATLGARPQYLWGNSQGGGGGDGMDMGGGDYDASFEGGFDSAAFSSWAMASTGGGDDGAKIGSFFSSFTAADGDGGGDGGDGGGGGCGGGCGGCGGCGG